MSPGFSTGKHDMRLHTMHSLLHLTQRGSIRLRMFRSMSLTAHRRGATLRCWRKCTRIPPRALAGMSFWSFVGSASALSHQLADRDRFECAAWALECLLICRAARFIVMRILAYVRSLAMRGSLGRCSIQCNPKAPVEVPRRSAGCSQATPVPACLGNRAL